MNAQVHISNGVAKQCRATINACPIGGSHFDNLHEANEHLLEKRKEQARNAQRIELLVKNDYLYSDEEKAILRQQIRTSMRDNPLPTALPKGIDITNFAALMKEPMVIQPPDKNLITASLQKHKMTLSQMVQAIRDFDTHGSFAALRGAHMTRRIVAYARMSLLDYVAQRFQQNQTNTVQRNTVQSPATQPTLSQRAVRYAGQYAKNSLKRGTIRIGKKMYADFNKYTTFKL